MSDGQLWAMILFGAVVGYVLGLAHGFLRGSSMHVHIHGNSTTTVERKP